MQPAFFLLRRLILAIAVVILYDVLIGQIFLIWGQSTIALFIIEFTRPFKTQAERRMEIFNEVILMLVLYTMMCFTDFVPEIETKMLIGWVACTLVALHFSINLTIMVLSSVRKTIRTCRMKMLLKKYSKGRIVHQRHLQATHSRRRKRMNKLYFQSLREAAIR